MAPAALLELEAVEARVYWAECLEVWLEAGIEMTKLDKVLGAGGNSQRAPPSS